jgi:hypothetical protein
VNPGWNRKLVAAVRSTRPGSRLAPQARFAATIRAASALR